MVNVNGGRLCLNIHEHFLSYKYFPTKRSLWDVIITQCVQWGAKEARFLDDTFGENMLETILIRQKCMTSDVTVIMYEHKTAPLTRSIILQF